MNHPEFSAMLRAEVLGVPVAAVTTSEFCISVLRCAASSPAETEIVTEPVFITYLNAACSNIAADSSHYREILRDADCVYADGQAIVWAAKYLGQALPERVNAGDFIIDFCRMASDRNIKLGLVGGRPGVAERAAEAWTRQVPQLNCVIAEHGFFQDGGEALATAVAAAKPDVLLVGMGVPLQEEWAWKHRSRLGTPVVWCVGALFEYYGEGRARAPVWVRRAGFEWLFRLALEPRRLWKRYIIGNVRFVLRCLRARSGK